MPLQRSAKGREAFASASGVCKGSGEPGSWGVSATELPTDDTYTGQREAAEIGLKYFIARWYDSEIGQFIQADSIVLRAENPLAWNRYAYVNYNPPKYTDPSGHFTKEELIAIFGPGYRDELSKYSNGMQAILQDDDVGFGDLNNYSINGEEYSGIFVLDDNGLLALWDLDQRQIFDLDYEINPLPVYENTGEATQFHNESGVLFHLIWSDSSNDAPPEDIYLPENWQFSKDNRQMATIMPEVYKWSFEKPSVLGWALLRMGGMSIFSTGGIINPAVIEFAGGVLDGINREIIDTYQVVDVNQPLGNW